MFCCIPEPAAWNSSKHFHKVIIPLNAYSAHVNRLQLASVLTWNTASSHARHLNLRDRQRNCQPQRARRKSLKRAELLGHSRRALVHEYRPGSLRCASIWIMVCRLRLNRGHFSVSLHLTFTLSILLEFDTVSAEKDVEISSVQIFSINLITSLWN